MIPFTDSMGHSCHLPDIDATCFRPGDANLLTKAKAALLHTGERHAKGRSLFICNAILDVAGIFSDSYHAAPQDYESTAAGRICNMIARLIDKHRVGCGRTLHAVVRESGVKIQEARHFWLDCMLEAAKEAEND